MSKSETNSKHNGILGHARIRKVQNPARGCLFIATVTDPPVSLFVFRRRGLPVFTRPLNRNLIAGFAAPFISRRRKTQRKLLRGVLFYKQATPSGVFASKRHG